MPNVERQSFISEMENTQNKPNSIRNLFEVLIDYFLENQNRQNEVENPFSETKFAS